LLKGDIQVESVSGEGSTFVVLLPMGSSSQEKTSVYQAWLFSFDSA